MTNLYLSVASLAVPLLLITQWLVRLSHNYRIAQKSGLPILVTPFNPDSVLFMISQRFLGSIYETILPFDGVRVSLFGWSFKSRKDSLFKKHGDIFVLVNPGTNQVWCANSAVTQVVLTRRKDFLQSSRISQLFGFLGPSVFTSNHDSWARQRRLVAPKLNERISEIVWEESTNLASQMEDYMLQQPGGSSHQAISGLRAIAINILGHVGYGQSKDFSPNELPKSPDTAMTYVDAISLCTMYILYAAVFPVWFMRLPFMPTVLQTLGVAKQQAPSLRDDMLKAELRREKTGGETADNLMSMLAHFAGSEKTKGGSENAPYLSEDEISGNLFVFTAAGFDTTANTMSYAITLLAAYPEWQEWVQEEIDHVWNSLTGDSKDRPDYAAIFPRLPRVLAIMLETLRIFPATLIISRETDRSQTLVVDKKTYTLEGPHRIQLTSCGLHYDPTFWGPDSYEFRPTRWMEEGSVLGAGQTIAPAKGTYFPWGGGPRVCPGMKMAQVEFVAVMTTFFRKCRIEPVVQPGETLEQARKHLLERTEDSTQKVSMQMNKPEQVNLKWHRR